MDCQSIAATETNNIGSGSAADRTPARMMHAERRFPRRSSLLLGALPSPVPCARLHARQVLWEWGLSEVAETAELLLSELVTNAVQAARTTVSDLPVNVCLSANRDRLLIEVWDSYVQSPLPRMLEHGFPEVDAESERGLVSRGHAERAMGLVPDAKPRRQGDLVRTRPGRQEELGHAHNANIQVPLAAGPNR